MDRISLCWNHSLELYGELQAPSAELYFWMAIVIERYNSTEVTLLHHVLPAKAEIILKCIGDSP